MMDDKHRNPDGTWNGVGVLSDLTGLPREEVQSIAERVKANLARLEACPYHEFEAIAASEAGLRLSRRPRYRCRHCGGEIDSTAYHWHEMGRRERQ
ncbi:hypothetical protein [Halomonas sp. H5]|uniref:hypothetical protein n=1 Tax=Halomonas sp. H5 TaxID=3423910 RepID=UPI003D368087